MTMTLQLDPLNTEPDGPFCPWCGSLHLDSLPPAARADCPGPQLEQPVRNPSGWILTYTGRQFWPFEPRADELDIRDIAHALANICRFTGHVSKHYSVAQHSCLVADLVPDEMKLAALLHDASEAYLTDLSRPVKNMLPDYKRAEDRLSRLIAERFGVAYPWAQEIKDADNVMLATERRDLMPKSPVGWRVLENVTPTAGAVVPWSVDKRTAAGVFLAAFRMYGGKA